MNEKNTAVVIMIACTFPGCKANMAPEKAKVPAVAAIRSAIGKPVTVADLASQVLCPRHAHMAKQEGVPTFSYVGTVALLECREAERTTARSHFLHLRAKTQMGKAIAKALAPASAG
ncbi:MAG: hypothetical protein Q8Q89_04605 [bacterium]|nr:hypothetical protein [bacterium]